MTPRREPQQWPNVATPGHDPVAAVVLLLAEHGFVPWSPNACLEGLVNISTHNSSHAYTEAKSPDPPSQWPSLAQLREQPRWPNNDRP